jgi:hypothetical protein
MTRVGEAAAQFKARVERAGHSDADVDDLTHETRPQSHPPIPGL